MIALYDYDPMELSPNVDMEVSLRYEYATSFNMEPPPNQIFDRHLFAGRAEFSNWRHHHCIWGDGRRRLLHGGAAGPPRPRPQVGGAGLVKGEDIENINIYDKYL